MPQPFQNAVMTCAGAMLLTRAQAGEIKIEFTRIAIGDGVYKENEKSFSALQAQEGLKAQKNSYALSGIEVYSEHSVKITALITNQDTATGAGLVEDGYFINEMGLYAKEKGRDDDTEVLYSIAVTAGEYGDFMPPYNGFSAAQIIQEYYATVNHSAEITIQTSGAFVLAQDFEKFKADMRESIAGIEERLQWLTSLLCSYQYNRAGKAIVSLLPHRYAGGVLEFPEGAAYVDGSAVVLGSAVPGGFPPGQGGGSPGTGSMWQVAAQAAKIVQDSIVEVQPGQVKQLFEDVEGS